MRWQKEKHGTCRYRTRFLWLPVTIRGETRWLKRATWEEEWRSGKYAPGEVEPRWDKICWAN